MKEKPFIITISGGSGSGKTTFARRLREHLSTENSLVLYQDSYYIDQSDKFDHDGGKINFDHPNSLDFDLMADQINQLKNRKTVEVPFYDFATHSRKEETTTFNPKPFIIIDGILVLTQKNIRDVSDLMIFIDCDEPLRYERRLKRDTEERGRTPDGVKVQFFAQVKPMHDKFVEPSKDFAHILVNSQNFDDKLKEVITLLKKN
jgi:uridine kinase